MEENIIDAMKRTKRLKLSFWDTLSHYIIALFLLLPIIVTIPDFIEIYILNSYSGFRSSRELLRVNTPFIILSVLFYFIQYYKLKFKVVETSLSRNKIHDVILKTADELDWITEIDNTEMMQFKTYPSFWSGSWGEQITIVYDSNRLLINSICDPKSRLSVFSMGRNRRNEIIPMNNLSLPAVNTR